MDDGSVRHYFDRQAEGYQHKISSGWLGRICLRERALVVEMLEPQPGESILDAGCGTGFYASVLMQAGCVVRGLDLSPAMVEVAKRCGIDASVADVRTFSFGQQYDKVFSSGLLEFCPDPQAVVSNLAAHLKDGGRFVILFPIRNLIGRVYRLFHRAHGLRVFLYSVGEMKDLLVRHGLAVRRSAKSGPFTAALSCDKRSS